MNEYICRLCLQTITDNNFQAVEESLLKSLKLDLKISKENVMCIECASSLQVFSNFTAGCVYMRDETLPPSDLENGPKSDQEPIETASNPKSLVDTKIKCSFCTRTRGREDLILLQVVKENKSLVNMLEQYISKTNLKNTEDFLTCNTCLEALEGVLSVISKCLRVEEEIRKYIELKGTDDKGQVELKDVQRFTLRPIIKSERESFSINKLEGIRCDQIQDEYTTMDELKIKDEKPISYTELIVKTEEADIKFEEIVCDITDIKSEQSDCDEFQEPFNEDETPNDPLPVAISKTRKSKDRIKQRPSTHTNPSEIETFKCKLCSYKTKHYGHFRQHLLIHKIRFQMFKCELCPYETHRKVYLKQHYLIHKSPSELKMVKCELCSFEAKRNSDLNRHLLTHKSSSEIKMFKCELCSYKARQKVNLKTHLLTHKSPSEIEMFKCVLCSFETKYSTSLKRHLLTHKSPSEIMMFKCELCPYEATHKAYLNRHLLFHKSPSEIEMFKYKSCSYEAKRKGQLKQHSLVHEGLSKSKT